MDPTKQNIEPVVFTWVRRNAYEVSSVGDKRFSAFNAIMSDGRSIEQIYHCDIKGFDPGGTNWKLGKGKDPINDKTREQLWTEYLNLWRVWASDHLELMRELYFLAKERNCVLSDCFAATEINQAHALSTVLNELILNNAKR